MLGRAPISSRCCDDRLNPASACRSTGPGHTPSPPPWDTSATCPNSSEPPTAPGAAQPNPTRHQPATTPNPDHTHPKTRQPAHTHQPSGHPAPNRRSHKPVGGFRLKLRADRVGVADGPACLHIRVGVRAVIPARAPDQPRPGFRAPTGRPSEGDGHGRGRDRARTLHRGQTRYAPQIPMRGHRGAAQPPLR